MCRGSELPVKYLDWLKALTPESVSGPDHAVDISLRIAERSVVEGVGGPFGAVVYEIRTGRVVGAGVNMVELTGVSLWHAEAVALNQAQLNIPADEWNKGEFALASSCQPCVMCLGITHWAKIKEIHFSASQEDAEEIGFDEGPAVDDVISGLRERGVKFFQHDNRLRGQKILRNYRERGGLIY